MERKEENQNSFNDIEPQIGGTEPDAEGRTETPERSDTADGSDELQRTLAAKTQEAQGLQDKFLRLAAEFDNYKRITQREQREQAKFANENLLKELLPTVDNLERAIGFAISAPGCDQLVEGVKLTLKQFLETLTKFGVRPIKSVGERFDPALHQAVAHVPTQDVATDTVVEEYQKGYLLYDRVVRAAMVGVAAPEQSEQ